MKPWNSLLLITLLAAGSTPALGGTVVLRTGETVRGEILEETPATVRVRTARGVVAITRDRIAEIRASAPGEIDLYKAQDLLARNQLDQASAALTQAEQVGGSNEETKALRERVNEAIRRRDLQRYRSILQEARVAATRGAESPALTEIRQILASLPEDSPTRIELIDVLCAFHTARAKDASDKVRNTEAVQELRAIIALDPNRPDPHIGLGDLYRTSSGTFNEAIYHFNRALELGADRLSKETVTRIHWELGELYRQQRRFREASISYREAYRRDPQVNLRLTDRMIEVMREFAEELSSTNITAAIAVIDEALRARQLADLHIIRGRYLAQNNQFDESSAAIQSALAMNPRIRDAYYQMALNAQSRGQILETRANLEREVANFPNHYEALVLLGNLALQRDDNQAAERFFTSALNVDSDRPAASLGLSRVHRRNKDLTRAKERAMQVLSRFPEDRAANLEMGNIFLDEGNNEEARRYFTSVLELVDRAIADRRDTSTSLAELKQLKADALLARGEVQLLTAGPGTANQNFRDALEAVPDYPQAYFAIGNAYRKKFGSSKNLADLKEAENNLIKARTLAPQNAQYALEIGILYAQQLAVADSENEQSYRVEAVRHWRDYISLGGADVGRVEAWIREIEG